MQELKIYLFYKVPNILHFTPIRTDRTHKQGGLLTYNKSNTSFSELETPNTSPIQTENYQNSPSYITATTHTKMYISLKHTFQLSQTE